MNRYVGMHSYKIIIIIIIMMIKYNNSELYLDCSHPASLLKIVREIYLLVNEKKVRCRVLLVQLKKGMVSVCQCTMSIKI